MKLNETIKIFSPFSFSKLLFFHYAIFHYARETRLKENTRA